MRRPPPKSTLFPYTTLFRSQVAAAGQAVAALAAHQVALAADQGADLDVTDVEVGDRKSTRLNSSHQIISYAVFCLKKKKLDNESTTVTGDATCSTHRWANVL